MPDLSEGGGESEGKKMKGDGEGESEGTRKIDYEKANNDIKVSGRRFIKTTAAFGAAVAGIPYNLTDITDIVLKEDGELMMYPVISEIEYKLIRKLSFERIICIKPWGCNWNCRWCPMKIAPYNDMKPMMISIDQIIGLLPYLGVDTSSTLITISGGEPLLQTEEVLKLISSLKANNYTVMLFTNGCLIDENFIERANEVGLD
ncbi:MAG: radical SAM protein [Halobacteriota archaeon]